MADRRTTAELRDALLAAGYTYDPKTRRAIPISGGPPLNRRAIQRTIGEPLPQPLREGEREMLARFVATRRKARERLTERQARSDPRFTSTLLDFRNLIKKRDVQKADLTMAEAKTLRTALRALYGTGRRTKAWEFYVRGDRTT